MSSSSAPRRRRVGQPLAGEMPGQRPHAGGQFADLDERDEAVDHRRAVDLVHPGVGEQRHHDAAGRDHRLRALRQPVRARRRGTARSPPSRTASSSNARSNIAGALDRHPVDRDEPAGKPVGGDVLGDPAGEFRVDVDHRESSRPSGRRGAPTPRTAPAPGCSAARAARAAPARRCCRSGTRRSPRARRASPLSRISPVSRCSR